MTAGRDAPDAIVVGSGPNGLAAAITLARDGRSVAILEAEETPGGGMRSAELTLPGFTHDICSAIHPLVAGSPFFRALPLDDHGLELCYPAVEFAHPLDDGTAILGYRSVEETADALGKDGRAYRKLMGPLTAKADDLAAELLGPFRPPKHPLLLARFGLRAIRSAAGLASSLFEEPRARALMGGLAAHSMLPLDKSPTAGVALVLGMLAHAVGWPAAVGGSQKITDALVSYATSLGVEITTGTRVEDVRELPPARAVLLDVTPKQLLAIAGSELSESYKRGLRRYRYGPGVFKLDWALDGPVPWKAEDCSRAGTVHLGGTLPELAASEGAVNAGRHTEKPFVLLAQQSSFDTTRAPAGRETLWAYCHVPSGSNADMTDAIENQIERFAPGFRDRILARNKMGPADFEQHNANCVGGDINGGVQDLWQHFTRPVARPSPYTTSNKRIYICSSSTPPGGGVHGMCGYFAAKAAIRRAF